MAKWAYDMTHGELVDAFEKEVIEAAPAARGLVIDPFASLNAQEARYFKGVLLSRLEGKKPPFRPKQQVRSTLTVCSSASGTSDMIKKGTEEQVKRIWYSRGNWHLEFECDRPEQGFRYFEAGKFEAVGVPEPQLA